MAHICQEHCPVALLNLTNLVSFVQKNFFYLKNIQKN